MEINISDKLIEPSLKNSLHKMIFEPFYENFKKNYRFFSGSSNDLSTLVENRDSSKLEDLFKITMQGGFVIKKNSGNFEVFKLDKLESGQSSLELMGGDTWFINDIKKDNSMDYNLSIINFLMNNNRQFEPTEEFTIYNNYSKLFHEIMDEKEREKVQSLFRDRSSLMINQLRGGVFSKSSRIKQVNNFRIKKMSDDVELLRLSKDLIS